MQRSHRILSMIVALFVGVYVARYLGPERFGLLSYAMSFVGLFTALATLGLDGIMVRELVKTPERRDELLGTAVEEVGHTAAEVARFLWISRMGVQKVVIRGSELKGKQVSLYTAYAKLLKNKIIRYGVF